jgi:hypothetical protein
MALLIDVTRLSLSDIVTLQAELREELRTRLQAIQVEMQLVNTSDAMEGR